MKGAFLDLKQNSISNTKRSTHTLEQYIRLVHWYYALLSHKLFICLSLIAERAHTLW